MLSRPRTYTTNEAFIDDIREAIMKSGLTYKVIADGSGVGQATVQRIASGHTKWPRPTTLFPMLSVLKLQIQLVSARSK